MLMKIFLIKSLSRLIKAIFQVVEHKADVVRLQLMLEVGGIVHGYRQRCSQVLG